MDAAPSDPAEPTRSKRPPEHLLKWVLDLGTQGQADAARNRSVRFANAMSLIVCLFIVQNAALAWLHGQPQLLWVYLMHFIGIALVPLFNGRGHPLAASAWFSTVALVFVSLYSIVFGVGSYNFMFLLIIIIIQFFLFSSSGRPFITFFVAISVLCFVGILALDVRHLSPWGSLPAGLIEAQRLNSLVGLPLLAVSAAAPR